MWCVMKRLQRELDFLMWQKRHTPWHNRNDFSWCSDSGTETLACAYTHRPMVQKGRWTPGLTR